MNHANKTQDRFPFHHFNRDKSKYEKMLRDGWGQGMKTRSITVLLGHWKWLTCQEACDSVQPRLPRLTEKRGRPLQKNNADVTGSVSRFMKVQALLGRSLSVTLPYAAGSLAEESSPLQSGRRPRSRSRSS